MVAPAQRNRFGCGRFDDEGCSHARQVCVAMRLIRRYIAHDDPLVATANLIALVLGYNTPLYPFYLFWVTGTAGLPWALLTLCSCPFFLAIPALSRSFPLASRLMLCFVGALNTIFCTWLLGAATGIELFFLPCLALAALLFRADERLAMACAALPPVLAFFLVSHYGVPPVAYTAVQAHAVLRLNASSVGTLIVFVGVVFARLVPKPAGVSTSRRREPHLPL